MLVTTGVVVNALFLQNAAVATKATTERPPARPPAADRARKPGEVTRTDRPKQGPAGAAKEQPLRIAHFAADTAKLDAMLPAAQGEVATETVRAIQRELKSRGYGPLVADGVMGLTTRAGIMAFEYDQGLGLTGEASEDLLRRLLIGGPADAEPAGAGKVRSVHAEQVIRTVQQRLSGLGYRVGRVDGWLGEDTVKAIRDFEMDKGLVPKGRISAELVTRLIDAAVSKPAGR